MFSLNEFLNRRHVLLSGTTATVCTIAILISGTRGAWLGAAVVVALFLVPRLRPRQRVAAVAAVVALGVLVSQIPGVVDLFVERTELRGHHRWLRRTDIWSVGLRIGEAYPLAGVGHANFPVAYRPSLVPGAEALTFLGFGRAPHSILVGTFAELGIVGLALLLLFLGPFLVRRGWGADAAVVQSILVSIMVSALFLDVLVNRKAGVDCHRAGGGTCLPPTARWSFPGSR